MILGMDHVGISVPNLARSIAFYRDVLGMKLLAEVHFSGEKYDAILGLEGARGTAALLVREKTGVELFEFAHPIPIQRERDCPVSHHGISHFCLQVRDLDQEYRRMVAAGVRFHSAPLEFPGHVRAAYGRDPDGNAFELLEVLKT
jgi:catechol 2,3-dioxygenase-like lactoylglutathione lyase family enzyme